MNTPSPGTTETSALSFEDLERWRRNVRTSTFSHYHYKMGVALDSAGVPDAALAAFRRALDIDPTRAEIYWRIADIHRRLGETAEAETAQSQGRALDPDVEALGMAQAANDHIDLGQYDEAEPLLCQALAAAPHVAERICDTLIDMGLYRKFQKQTAEACRWLEAAAPFRDNDPTFLYEYGTVLRLNGRIEEAVDRFTRSVEIAPGVPLHRYHAGYSLALAHRLEEALAFLAPLKGEASTTDYAEVLIGLCLVLAGRPGEAVAMLDGLVERVPQWSWAWAWRAYVRFRSGQKEGAQQDLRRAFDLESEASNDTALAVRGIMHLAEGRAVDAAADFGGAAQLRPDRVIGAVGLGAARLVLGDRAGATEALFAALAQDPSAVPYTKRLIGPLAEALSSLTEGAGKVGPSMS